MPVLAAAFLWKPYKIIKDCTKMRHITSVHVVLGVASLLLFLLTITLTFIFCFTPGGFAWTLYGALHGAHSHGLHFWVCLVRNVHEIVFWDWLSALFHLTQRSRHWSCLMLFCSPILHTKPLCSCTYACASWWKTTCATWKHCSYLQ